MNTNQLKRFAQDARVKLIDQIGAKLEKVLTTDSVELREKAGHLKKLQEAINKTSKPEVIDTVAYTWFNRFVALRFMDVNGYEPIGVSVVSPMEGGTLPAILQEAKQGNIPEELPVQHQRIYDLLDGKIPSTDAQNEAYAALLVGACNHLSKTLPFLFEKIDDYAELLLPDDLISSFSIIEDIRIGMKPEDCAEVEIIGWLYQFYISEKKDQVFASKSKVKKEDIPAATQLFTPRWIVEYMVQNTVGKLWMQNNPQSKLRDYMPYFIESPSVTADDYLKIDSVEDITLLDQACGSGHILVYGFELLSIIYEEEGYNKSDIPTHIIEKNLFGFEIDTRAAQLAGLALMLKARHYYRRVFKKDITPNISCYQDLQITEEDIKATFSAVDEELSDALLHDLKTMQQATNLGSLIIPQATANDLEKTRASLAKKANNSDLFHGHNLRGILQAIVQLSALSRKYHCVVDNPPYMGGGNMNKALADFVKVNYPRSKADLMACFMEAGIAALKPKGFLGMINQHSWMFLSSYEKLREYLIETIHFDSMLHLGSRTFPEIGGEVVQNTSFVFNKIKSSQTGIFIRLTEIKNSEQKRTRLMKELIKPSNIYFKSNQINFNKITQSPIGYWLKKDFIDYLSQLKTINTESDIVAGICTGRNAEYIYEWTEVANSKIWNGYDGFPNEFKFKMHNKGGEARKWFGNHSNIINYNETSLCEMNKLKGFRHDGQRFYYKPSLSWSKITSSTNTFRYYPKGFVFDSAGLSIYSKENIIDYELLGFLNTKVAAKLLNLFNPTLNASPGVIRKLPLNKSVNSGVVEKVKNSINISKLELNTKEVSPDFQQNGLIRIKGQDLQEAYDSYCQYWQNKFFALHKNEEELNRHFIEIYGLQDELTPEVPLKDITILKEETTIKKGALVFRESEIMAQFISYAVGCMFGRYSLDKPGLVLANQGETLEDYLNNVTLSAVEVSFLPDDDNVIPILDNEWFEDDIVGRFYAFLKATFGIPHFDKNLAFVEDCVGDIRKYFLKTFYTDHIKRYKKRPIYWMFSSPSGAFNALIYMHRYTPNTLNTVLNGYLKEYLEKLKAQDKQLDHVKNVGTDREKVSAEKEQARINKVVIELQEYDRELFKLATERIAIDLDDGVLVNYNKFGTIIKPVSGLNDKKAKDKVRKFDWIDASTIQ
ncbi:BREX-1 system adenine-specific DNA-methyltransferase PglX [Gelidibacter salicanalis]|uniref:site-specific DNA-methyltransferase (adenine-specific) n=1 Tax=Gelidibacter salicanalis TaxID=291193 RepID=A0A934NIT8_9FLAO|nr:BREX-1 system adenine-specific DNA-methyltransferase PglX [Gelidibacter salicanalis]MBJ7881593.1 BREX-1 system adenine-specific DNA-methyltransferase PglX [Gelidibacter salicanalis]